MSDCIFCKIANKEIPSEIIKETDDYFVIKDINPQADVHLLIISKKHIASLAELSGEDSAVLSNILQDAASIAKVQGLTTGFRTIVNTGPGGQQEVPHLHFHILGGSKLVGF